MDELHNLKMKDDDTASIFYTTQQWQSLISLRYSSVDNDLEAVKEFGQNQWSTAFHI